MALVPENRTSNSTEIRDSRYVQGGETDRYNNRLGWWERREIPRASDDIRVTVTARQAGRPDTIAHDLYQNWRFGWLVLQYNNIVDPLTELTTGTELYMPSQSRLMLSIMTKPVGGNVVTEK